MALPFYTIEAMLSEWAYRVFKSFYIKMRQLRGDNCLLVHVLKSITVWIWKRDLRNYNRYGYKVVNLEKEKGTLDGQVEKKKYFLMFWKIYSNVFCTDCFGDYFKEKALESGRGLADWRTYAFDRATTEEMKEQHSYFVGEIYGK